MLEIDEGILTKWFHILTQHELGVKIGTSDKKKKKKVEDGPKPQNPVYWEFSIVKFTPFNDSTQRTKKAKPLARGQE